MSRRTTAGVGWRRYSQASPNHRVAWMITIARVLLAGGEEAKLFGVQQVLASAGHEVVHAPTLDETLCRVAGGDVDVVVLAHELSDALARVVSAQCGGTAAIIAVTERPTASRVRDALHAGASDVVDASAEEHVLLAAVERAAREAQLRRDLAMLRARIGDVSQQSLIGRSGGMSHVRELIGRAAGSRVPVLITGEAGTGKDVVARLIHDLSDRAARPFTTVRCADGDQTSLERELFGLASAEGGRPRAGLLERCSGGTVVLEDASALSTHLRAGLTRASLARVVQRIGAADSVTVDVRLILVVRTGRDADNASVVDALLDAFHATLVDVPPLRERRSDVPMLVQHFRRRLATEQGLELPPMSPDEMLPLLGHEWSGNVRELEHWVERALLTTRAEQTQASGQLAGIDLSVAQATLEQLERAYILHVLDREAGHQSRTAVRLGIDRRTLYRKLKQYRTGVAADHLT
jgi:DNA-binding NtrC family response regulator